MVAWAHRGLYPVVRVGVGVRALQVPQCMRRSQHHACRPPGIWGPGKLYSSYLDLAGQPCPSLPCFLGGAVPCSPSSQLPSLHKVGHSAGSEEFFNDWSLPPSLDLDREQSVAIP